MLVVAEMLAVLLRWQLLLTLLWLLWAMTAALVMMMMLSLLMGLLLPMADHQLSPLLLLWQTDCAVAACFSSV